MPRLSRRRRDRRSIDFDDLSLVGLMNLSSGWRKGDPRHNDPLFPTLESIHDFYIEHQTMIETLITDRTDPDWHHGRHPGKFMWVSWKFRLLLEEPRLSVPRDAYETSCASSCYGHCWETWDGFESSFEYIRGRELLEPGEIEAIALHDRHHTELTLKRHRWGRPHSGRQLYPWELASVARIFGESMLSDEDLAEAEPYLD